MGFLSMLFQGSSKLEKRLEKTYVPLLRHQMGLSFLKAKKVFYNIIREINESSKKPGAEIFPPGYGDTILEKEKTDEDIKKQLEEKRKEGVADEDIRKWWNMHNLERMLSIVFENYFKALLFAHLRSKGLAPKTTEERVSKTYPMYGDLAADKNENNKPLPYELKERINNYTIQRQKADPDGFKKDVEKHVFFNDLVRDEIKAGRL